MSHLRRIGGGVGRCEKKIIRIEGFIIDRRRGGDKATFKVGDDVYRITPLVRESGILFRITTASGLFVGMVHGIGRSRRINETVRDRVTDILALAYDIDWRCSEMIPEDYYS